MPLVPTSPIESSTSPSEANGAAALNRRLGPASWLGIYLATLTVLIVWHFGSLGDPPYFDAAMGLFTEANYLADSGFNYRRLWHEVSALDGGPRAYLISILPTFVAAAMWIAPNPASSLVLMHLGNLAVAAALLTLVGALAARNAGTIGGILIALAVGSTPLVAAQFKLVGMDLPMLAVAIWSLACVTRHRFGMAAVAGLLAFFIKPTGALVTLTNLALLAAVVPLWCARGGMTPAERRGFVVGVLANAVALAIEVGVYALSPNHEHVSSQSPGDSFLKYLIVVCPDLLVVAAIAAAGIVVALVGTKAKSSTAGGQPAPAEWAMSRLRGVYDRPLILYAAILSTGTLLAVVGYLQVYVPRYLLPLIPLLYLAIAETWLARSRWRKIGLATLVVIVAINCFNANGALYLDMGPMRRNGLYERSGEFRADLNSNRTLARMLESQYAGIPIAVGHPYTYYFSMPRLGYVKAPLRGYAINAFSRPELRPAVAMFNERPTKLVLVSVPNAFYQAGAISMPIAGPRASSEEAPDDGQPARLEELYRDHLASPLVATLVDLTAPALQPQAREDWYCDHLWYDAEIARATPRVILERATMPAGIGRLDLAARLLGRAATDCPANLDLRGAHARMLYEVGDLSAAARVFNEILRERPDDATTHLQLAYVRERQQRFDEAAVLLAQAVKLRDNFPEAWVRLGAVRLRRDDSDGAREAFERAVELDPMNAKAHNNLGALLARQNKLAEAQYHFAKALSLRPNYGEARDNLARVRTLLGRPADPSGS